jgi:hypothetical protein
LYDCRTEEGVVVVLFMGRKQQGIEYFATGDGRVVPEKGIDQARTIFELRKG